MKQEQLEQAQKLYSDIMDLKFLQQQAERMLDSEKISKHEPTRIAFSKGDNKITFTRSRHSGGNETQKLVDTIIFEELHDAMAAIGKRIGREISKMEKEFEKI